MLVKQLQIFSEYGPAKVEFWQQNQQKISFDLRIIMQVNVCDDLDFSK